MSCELLLFGRIIISALQLQKLVGSGFSEYVVSQLSVANDYFVCAPSRGPSGMIRKVLML